MIQVAWPNKRNGLLVGGMTESVGTFDYVIVGAGSAGRVLANRLSANGRRRALLLEAGGSDNYRWIHIPVGYLYGIGNPRTDWMYRTMPEAGLGAGRSPFRAGRGSEEARPSMA